MALEFLKALANLGPDISGNYAAAQVFQNLLGNLDRLGFFEFLLPFLLFLAIIFGVLKFTLEDKIDKSALALISIVASFFILNYSGGFGIQVAQFFTNFFGASMIILAGILVIIIFLGLAGIKMGDLLGIKTGESPPGHVWAFILLLIFIAILVFVGSGGGGLLPIPSSIGGFTSNDIGVLIFFLIVLGLAVWLLGGKGKEGQGGGGGKTTLTLICLLWLVIILFTIKDRFLMPLFL